MNFLAINNSSYKAGLTLHLCLLLKTSSNEPNSENQGDGPEDLSVKDKEEDEDDDDDDEKIIANQGMDPERLKAFNVSTNSFDLCG